MARGLIKAFPLGVLVALCAPAVTAGEPEGPDLASLVRPLAGTQRGGVFPGATTPFGMVQYSPNTDNAGGGGYRYAHPRTWGFGLNHLSGTGCPAMGDIVSLPTTGPVKTVDTTRQKTTFSHSSEQATPGYYAVTLDSSHVRAELSATPRTGWARFAYPPTKQAHVIVDPGAGFRGVRDSSVRIVGDRTVEGWVASWGYWNACPERGPNQYTLHFSMRFDRPFTAFGTGNGSRLHRGSRTARGADAGAYVSFDSATDPRPVVSKVGVSYVDTVGARRNLEAEGAGGYDFDAVRQSAATTWNRLLSRVLVQGGSEEQRETFYTALYHALIAPNVFSDVDGRYVGFDDRVHNAPPGQAHYTNYSMWDTYRSAQQVIDLVAPERVGDMMRSLLDDQRQAGWLPKWPFARYETNEMVGDPVANVIADAFLKGLMHGEDVAAAYGALIHNATDVPRGSPFEGRTGLDDYINRGFVPFRQGDDHTDSGSINMEYALNDCALALMAGRLGHQADARYLLRRAKRYRDTIHRSSRLAEARAMNGSWIRTSSERSGRGFKEGSALQYTWLAPQDVRGLADELGGRSATLSRLDRFFVYSKIPADPTRARFLWHGPSRYNPHNETDLQAPYLYDYLGEPSKTQDLVRAAETLFSTAPRGLPGSDDMGTMSGWYVLSALGIYPVTGGDDHYALTSPLFDHAEVELPGGAGLTIDAPGASSGLRHVSGVSLNGAPLATSQVSHAQLVGGGNVHLAFSLVPTTDTSWATGPQTPASPCAANPSTADVRLHLSERRSSRRRATIRALVHNAGDAAATQIRLTLRVTRGWSARLRSGKLSALGAGRSRTQVWVLRRRHGHRSPHGRADLSWGGSGALRTFATAR